MYQQTVAQDVVFTGLGLHSGAAVRLVVRPAPADTGIVFERTDLGVRIPAIWHAVEQTALNTRILGEDGASVSTIEHLMAALAGLGISNAVCEIDGPEVPILDGSALPFVRALSAAGVRRQSAPLQAIRILREVRVQNGDAYAVLSPDEGVHMSFHISFTDAAIGEQSRSMDLANGAFMRELSRSRTFCRQAEIDLMHQKGLALGGSLDNAVVVDGAAVLTPGGLRHPDEAVRHKMLDALGDLYTAGAQILGAYRGHKAGHALTNKLLRALFADPTAWRRVPVDAALWARMPGADLTAADLAAVA